jgi:hypothetical protein
MISGRIIGDDNRGEMERFLYFVLMARLKRNPDGWPTVCFVARSTRTASPHLSLHKATRVPYPL